MQAHAIDLALYLRHRIYLCSEAFEFGANHFDLLVDVAKQVKNVLHSNPDSGDYRFPQGNLRITCYQLLRCPNCHGHPTLLTGITGPFANRQASLSPENRDRKDPVGRSEEDPSRTSASPPK